MATLESYQCKGCGSPLDKDSLQKCPYCGSANFVKAEVNPMKMNHDVAQKYVEFFKQKTNENPKDTNSLFAMGLLYLGLKNYELAQRNFKEAIDLSPMESDVYYYYSLSLIHGKSLKTLNNQDIKRIEEYLHSAMSMQTKCKYLLLEMAIKQEYYIGNGMKIEGDSPEELYNKSQQYASTDVDELLTHVILRDEYTITCINTAVGISSKTAKKTKKTNSKYISQERRLNFFKYYYEPAKPGSKENPFPTFPIIRTIWTLGIRLVITFSLYAIFTLSGLGFQQNNELINKPTVKESFRKILKENDQTLTTKEKSDLFIKLRNDSIQRAQKDSIYNSETIILSTKIYNNEQQLFGIKRSPMSVFWILLIFVPLVLWIIKYVKLYKSISNQIKEIKEVYKQDLAGFNNKATFEEINDFVDNFLSDVVDYELKNNNKDEDDLKGKILFINYYDDTSDLSEYSVVRYMIALLEESKVTYLNNAWCLINDAPEKAHFHSAFYKDINSVKVSSDNISFGDISIPYPEKSLFEYQNTNSSDSLTYSTSRTSNVHEFKDALDKLIDSYKNK